MATHDNNSTIPLTDSIIQADFLVNPFADDLIPYLTDPNTFTDIIDIGDEQTSERLFQLPISTITPLPAYIGDAFHSPMSVGLLPLALLLPLFAMQAESTNPDLLFTTNHMSVDANSVADVVVGDHYAEFSALNVTDLFDIELADNSVMPTTTLTMNNDTTPGLLEQPLDTMAFSTIDLLAGNDMILLLPDSELVNNT